jgi:hypothetical protein
MEEKSSQPSLTAWSKMRIKRSYTLREGSEAESEKCMSVEISRPG